jgi:hypothetical protein
LGTATAAVAGANTPAFHHAATKILRTVSATR